jgi:hypothetical protein
MKPCLRPVSKSIWLRIWRGRQCTPSAQPQDTGGEDLGDFSQALLGSQVIGIGRIEGLGHRMLLVESMPAKTFAARRVDCLAAGVNCTMQFRYYLYMGREGKVVDDLDGFTRSRYVE